MDVIDRLIKEWSWRCEKGYPDLSNPRDIEILKEIFNVGLHEELSYDKLTPEALELAKAISGKFNIPLDDIKAYGPVANYRIVVYADINRRKFYEELEELGFERDKIAGSSQLGMRKGDVELIQKPKGIQKFGGAGKENESIFIGTLNSLIAESGTPVDITITDGTRKVRVENIDKVEDASARGAKEYSKSDADLLSAGEVRLGVSIKEDGAIRWESLKTRFSKIYDIFISKALNGQIADLMLASRKDAKKGKYHMQNAEGRNYGRVFIKDFPKDFDEEIIFGKDKVVVAERDFSSSDFSRNGDEIIIRVTNLYENLDQIAEDGKLPVIAFAHHGSKKYGIEMRAFMEKALPKEGSKANNLTISYNDLMA